MMTTSRVWPWEGQLKWQEVTGIPEAGLEMFGGEGWLSHHALSSAEVAR